MVNKLTKNLSKNQRDYLHYMSNNNTNIIDYSLFVKGVLVKSYEIVDTFGNSTKIKHLEPHKLIRKGFMKIVKTEVTNYFMLNTWELTDFFKEKFKQ